MHLYAIVFVVAVVWRPKSCENVSKFRVNHRRITDLIYSKYYRKDPPFPANSIEIPLTIDGTPIAILDINEVRHIFTYTAYFEVNWLDIQLSWNSSEYGNLNTVVIDSRYIWTPRLFIANSVDGFEFLDSAVQTVVYSDGNVFVNVAGVFKTTCTVDVTRYPFDTQVCILVICSTPWDHFHFKSSISDVPLKNHFSPQSEWILLNMSTDIVEMKNIKYQKVGGTYVKFFFKLKRKSMFYIVTTIFPMFLMSVLTSFVFLTPVDYGDKMSYLVSIFLSYAVFLNFITQNMPTSSEGDSLFEVYFLFVLVHCSLAILFTLIVININSHQMKKLVRISEIDKDTCKDLNLKDDEGFKGKVQDTRSRTLDIILFVLFLTMTIACPTTLILYK